MPRVSIEKGTILKSGDALYKVTGDFTQVDTKIDYELTRIFPVAPENVVTTSESELVEKMNREKVKIVKTNE